MTGLERHTAGAELFLHCCCGPCSLYPLQVLRQDGYDVTAYFCNPNIHPYREFLSRSEAFRDASASTGLPAVIESAYGLETFMSAIHSLDASVYKAKSPERCRVCYRIRMEKTAKACREAGLRTFATTLSVSPYQDHALIREAGENAAREYGLVFLYRDFRPGYRTDRAVGPQRIHCYGHYPAARKC